MTDVAYTTSDTPIGRIYLAAQNKSLIGVWMEGQKYFPAIDSHWSRQPDLPVLKAAVSELTEYFDGTRQRFTVPVKPVGTDFQLEVWQALTRIGFGQTLAYGELARSLGKPRAVRAVAAAVGRNPVSIIIPCHRVLGANGSLTGYAGGIKRKQGLLSLESGSLF